MLGSHDNAIKSVEYSSKMNGIVTGSWDKVSTTHSSRASSRHNPNRIFRLSSYGIRARKTALEPMSRTMAKYTR